MLEINRNERGVEIDILKSNSRFLFKFVTDEFYFSIAKTLNVLGRINKKIKKILRVNNILEPAALVKQFL